MVMSSGIYCTRCSSYCHNVDWCPYPMKSDEVIRLLISLFAESTSTLREARQSAGSLKVFAGDRKDGDV